MGVISVTGRSQCASKISKRRNPWAILPWFRQQGYLPEALVNFLALMGYSIPDEHQAGGGGLARRRSLG